MPVDIGLAFCKFPNRLFASGTAAKVGRVAALLYLALCECANREFPYASNTFSVSDGFAGSRHGLLDQAD